MCKSCVAKPFPERNNTCLDGGSYLLNFKSCAECGKRELVHIENKKIEQNGEDEEKVTYTHICSCCKHVIAEHCYEFIITDLDQNYEMNCLLCGVGEDRVQRFEPK